MDYLRVGKIVNTQGLRGEVRVISQTDFPDKRYKIGSQLTLFQEQRDDPVVLTIKSYRRHKNFDVLSFEDHPSINDVEKYRDGILKVYADDLQVLSENEFYYHEIIDLEVLTVDGKKIGKVKEILSPGANDVWVVKRESKKDVLIPYIEPVVKKIDLANGVVKIEWMEGLIDDET
ncbi:MAG: ribosome maturation factor RimM [Streptococcaceae bacterium]|nr:ribosome maturation factor RimM [Streptococcaceae bacterium]